MTTDQIPDSAVSMMLRALDTAIREALRNAHNSRDRADYKAQRAKETKQCTQLDTRPQEQS